MIMRRVGCSIAGCCNPTYRGKEWCQKHYMRWYRTGDPLGVSAAPGEPHKFLQDALMFEGEECLFWPFGKNGRGYGTIQWGGKTTSVHRIVCTKIHGDAPTFRHQAAHSCGNGHLSCCNPKHLRWATPEENWGDRKRHGVSTITPNAKLKPEDVVRIMELKGTMSNEKIGEMFGVTHHAVYQIHVGRRWKHLWENHFVGVTN